MPDPPGRYRVDEVELRDTIRLDIIDTEVSLGLWSWLAIVEQEADRLSEGAQNALGLLREDLEKLANDSD